MSSTFKAVQPGIQLGIQGPIHSIVDAVSAQLEIPMLASVGRPVMAPEPLVAACRSYREACRLAFALRRVKGMCARSVAAPSAAQPPTTA